MRIPKAYLETTVFNFCFADDAPERRQETLALMDEIKAGRYEPYTSDHTLQELVLAPEPKKGKMVGLLEEYGIVVLPSGEDVERLADIYVAEGAIPKRFRTDALHIAAASVHDLDFIVSLNFKHIVKRKTLNMAESINIREGYKRIGIFSPAEVIE